MHRNPKAITTVFIASLVFAVLWTALHYFHLTWTIYDELAWVKIHLTQTFAETNQWDWDTNARFRPIIFLTNFSKFALFGYSPGAFKLERTIEFALGAIALVYVLRHSRKLSLVAATFGALYFIKAPPVAEQLEWTMLSELTGCLFLIFAFLIRGDGSNQSRRIFSWIALICVALTKEPFLILLSLPALLERKYVEAGVAAALTIFSLAFLKLHAHGYAAASGSIQFGVFIRFCAKALLDFIWIVPPMLLAIRARKSKTVKAFIEEFWEPILLIGFSTVYTAIMLPRAWGYTYFFAPAVLLDAMAFAWFVNRTLPLIEKRYRKLPLIAATVMAVLFVKPFLIRTERTLERAEALDALIEVEASHPQARRIGSNCSFDNEGFALSSDLITHGAHTAGIYCINPNDTLDTCCQSSDLVVLGSECEGASSGNPFLGTAKTLWSSKTWKIIDCSK